MIKTKEDAKRFLEDNREFTDHDYIEGEFWFRYDGEDTLSGKPYTINHETEGIIGVTLNQAVSYVFRNRKRLNKIIVDK